MMYHTMDINCRILLKHWILLIVLCSVFHHVRKYSKDHVLLTVIDTTNLKIPIMVCSNKLAN